MKHIYITLTIFINLNLLFSELQAQLPKGYFQQEVNTVIKVKLDDQKHKLSGQVFIDYTNHSKIELDTIYFHLWANAYQDKNSAFSKQMIDNGDTRFYFAKEDQLGAYDSLNFRVDGKIVKWEYDLQHKDIAFILLEKSLKSGESIQISTPFTLKIPGSFSRLGHEKNSYQITQWFPKPAVFDKSGWHPMPYLNMGEFYSEFGNYDVTITLPENYFVSATGELLTKSELQRIEQRHSYTKKYLDTTTLKNNYQTPTSSKKWKSIRYIAENVHDFAWFADKRFLIQEGEVLLESGKKVKTQAFFLHNRNKSWNKSLKFVERGLKFYSEHVGDYPYPKVSAVQGNLGAGGGMEYPMVTIISEAGSEASVDKVIIHEIGHNWFYGILGFNERTHPWMDEGINSYYDHRYEKRYYNNKSKTEDLPKFISSFSNSNLFSIYHRAANKKALSQPSILSSDEFSMYNYFISTYENPAAALHYLALYMGQDKFDAVMQEFYNNWKFKHPGPKDFRAHFDMHTEKDLSWFFDGMIGDTRVFDYAFKGCKKTNKGYKVSIENQSPYAIPFQLAAYKNENKMMEKWEEGFTGTRDFYFDLEYDHFEIDPQQLYPDNNPHNNLIRSKGLLKKIERPDLAFLDVVDDPKSTQISWLPSLGWNKSDGLMIGAMFFNTSLPDKSFQYFLHPSFSLGSERITGQGKISYNWFQNRTLRNIQLSLSGRSFHYELPLTVPLRYTRISPEIKLTFNQDLTNRKRYFLSFTHHLLTQKLTYFNGKEINSSHISRVTLEHQNNHTLNPYKWKMLLENAFYENPFQEKSNYLKISGEWNSSFQFDQNKKLNIRVFGGSFLYHTNNATSVSQLGTFHLMGDAGNDYAFEDYFFDRTAQEGLLSRQLNLNGGGFKNALGPQYSLGQSNKYMLAINVYSDLPFNLPVLNAFKLYFDAGMFGYLPTVNDGYTNKFLYSGGIMLASFENLLNIYLPLIYSKDFQDIYKLQDNYFHRISFSINLKLLDINRLAQRDDLIYQQ